MDRSDESPSAALLRLVNGYQVTQAIRTAVELGVADLLAEGPRASDDLAAAAGAHPATLYRLLRALASVGVLREEPERRFALTPMGACLRSDAREPLGEWAAFVGRPYHFAVWADLPHSVRTGESANERVLGMSGWDYRQRHPDEGAIFDRAMTGNSRRQAAGLLAAYDFGRFGTIVDVGGGQGAFLAAVLAKHPQVRGVLLDQPHVVAGAETVLGAAGVAERCRVVGGSFFEAVPEGGDAYLLKYVLHDWADEEAVAILRACRRASGLDAALLVLERVVPPPNEGWNIKFSDLNMLVGPGGRERTREEFAELFAAAGFRLVGVTAAGPLSVIQGMPA
jgi:hypothetical protein